RAWQGGSVLPSRPKHARSRLMPARSLGPGGVAYLGIHAGRESGGMALRAPLVQIAKNDAREALAKVPSRASFQQRRQQAVKGLFTTVRVRERSVLVRTCGGASGRGRMRPGAAVRRARGRLRSAA